MISLGDSVGIALDDSGRLDGFYYNGTDWPQTFYTDTLVGTGWHDVAFTFDNTNHLASLYLDGSEVGSTNTLTDSISYTLGANTFIGINGNGGSSWNFTGEIADARIYDRALSPSEISTLANDLQLTTINTAPLSVTAVNPAPVLSGANDLATISQTPASNHGTLVSSIISGDVTDANPEALSGMAVTSVDDTNGIWEYSTNAGDTWTNFDFTQHDHRRCCLPPTTARMSASSPTRAGQVPTTGYLHSALGTKPVEQPVRPPIRPSMEAVLRLAAPRLSASITVNPTLHVVDVTTAADNDDSGIVLGDSAEDINWLEANIGPDNAISLREAIIAVDNTPGAGHHRFQDSWQRDADDYCGFGVPMVRIVSLWTRRANPDTRNPIGRDRRSKRWHLGNALNIDASNSTIEGFSIYGTPDGNGVQIDNISGVVVRATTLG